MEVPGPPQQTRPDAELPMTCGQILLYSQHPRYTGKIKVKTYPVVRKS